MSAQQVSSTKESTNYKHQYIERVPEVSSKKPLLLKKFALLPRMVRLESLMKTSKIHNAFDDSFGDEKTSTIMPARYYVKSKSCKMPYADPFSQEVLEIYRPTKLKVCTNESSLFELSYNVIAGSYILQVNKKVLRLLRPHNNARCKCNYRAVSWGDNISGVEYTEVNERVYFKNSCTLPQHIRGIIVECHEGQSPERIVQKDAFTLVQAVNKSVRLEPSPMHRQPSVILIGLDSMSRMNFRRTMPKTMDFVNKQGWFEMEGYNKVADNSVANIIPVLTGHTREHFFNLSTACNNVTNCFGGIDNFPWIWRNFKKAGYATALAEDNLASTFSNSLKVFQEMPTSHYFRPMLLSMENAMGSYLQYGYKYCTGRRLNVDYVLDFCQQFIERYVNELNQPVFGFFWSRTLTHDFYYDASSLDGKLVQFLTTWQTHSLFDRAIVVLFSDHGAQYGDLMELSDSFLEERLPMLHIYLPPWFREAYPGYAQALHLNRNRLSSNFDLYNTLHHILKLNATLPGKLPPLINCPSSQSLLHVLPQDRSCEEACISEHWCTCNEYIPQHLNGEMYYIGKLLLYHINRWMLLNSFNKYCARIFLYDMDSVEKKVLLEANGEASIYGSIVTYRIGFRTFPGTGKFKCTIRFNRERKRIEHLYVPDITRLSTYHNESLCLNDSIGKKFCVCYSLDKLSDTDDNWKNVKLTTIETI